MIKGIPYLQLAVEHWSIALEFYRDLLGLPIEQVLESERWVAFDLAGAKLVIYGGGIASDRPKGWDRNAFIPNVECDQIEATVAELVRRGVPFAAPLATRPDGYKVATCVDPEGNRIQLFEWTRTNE